MSDDLERRLRDAVRPSDLPPAPAGLRMRLVELEQRPVESRRRASRRMLVMLIPVAAILLLGLSALIGAGQRSSVTTPTLGMSAYPSAVSPSPTALGSRLPSGGIAQAQAIKLASANSSGWTFISASAGAYRDLRPPGSGPGDGITPDRLVWVIKFASDFTICNPLGVCLSPRPGTVTVYLDFFTGALLSSAGFSAP